MRLKLTDVLMLRELAGPLLFGVALFTMLGMSITYLFAFTDYAVRGVDILVLIEMAILYLPGMLVKTLPASMLLAALLATGRMSGDSEATALFSVGTSLWRIIRAVAFVGLGISLVTIAMTEWVVPPASQKAYYLKFRIVEKMQQNPLHPAAFPIYDGKDLEWFVAARNGDFARRTFWGCVIIHYSKTGSRRPDAYVYSPEVHYQGGSELLVYRLLGVRMKDEGAPEVYRGKDDYVRIPLGGTGNQLEALFRNFETQQNKDPDATNMAATLRKIEDLRKINIGNGDDIRNLQMGFYNKMAFPLATLIFALVGAPLGIRQSRTSNALGFALALVIIFAYWMLSSYMAVLGQGGAIPPFVASFAPNLVGLFFAIGLLIKRSR